MSRGQRRGSTTPCGGVGGCARGCRAYYDFGSRWGNLVARVGGGYMKGGRFADLFSLGSWTGLRGVHHGAVYRPVVCVWQPGVPHGPGAHGLYPIGSIFRAFRGKVFQLQGAVFADVGGVAGSGAYRTEEHGVPLVFIGAGLRMAVVNIYKAIMRIDFAYTLSPYRSFDLIVATQQYF